MQQSLQRVQMRGQPYQLLVHRNAVGKDGALGDDACLIRLNVRLPDQRPKPLLKAHPQGTDILLRRSGKLCRQCTDPGYLAQHIRAQPLALACPRVQKLRNGIRKHRLQHAPRILLGLACLRTNRNQHAGHRHQAADGQIVRNAKPLGQPLCSIRQAAGKDHIRLQRRCAALFPGGVPDCHRHGHVQLAARDAGGGQRTSDTLLQSRQTARQADRQVKVAVVDRAHFHAHLADILPACRRRDRGGRAGIACHASHRVPPGKLYSHIRLLYYKAPALSRTPGHFR